MPDQDWRPKVTRIDDPIAEDYWEYVTPQGKRRISRLLVGRPTHYPKARAWYCPILIEGHTPQVDTVFGQGPVDALMNAMGVVRTFFEENLSVVPGAKPKSSASKKAPARKPPVKMPQRKPRRR